MLIYLYKFIDHLKSSPARKNKLILIPAILSLLINLCTWGIIYFRFRPLVMNLPPDQSFIPLHYNIFLGVDSFGTWQNIFWLPAIGLIFFIINTIFSLFVYHKKTIISYFLSLVTPALEIILFIATLLIILINI